MIKIVKKRVTVPEHPPPSHTLPRSLSSFMQAAVMFEV